MEDGQVTEPGEEERKSSQTPEEPQNPGVPPSLEGPQNPAKLKVPEGSLSPNDVQYKRQRMEEEEERNRAPRGERVLEQVRDQDLARSSKEEVEDKFNATCRGCGITFGGRKRYLQDCWVAHRWTIKTKGGLVFPPLSLPDHPRSPDPTPKRTSQKIGQSLPPAQGPGAQDGSREA